MDLRQSGIAALLFATSVGNAVEITPHSESPTPVATELEGCVVPKYTQELLESLESGRVRVGFAIDADGKTESAEIVSSSGSPRLDAETIKAVRSCTFKPVLLNGKGTAAQVVIPFDWVIPGLARPKLQVDSDCRPSYPRSAREKGSTGTTVMSFLVKANGELAEPLLMRSSGSADLDAATKGLVECKAVPGSLNGALREMRMVVGYVWRMEGQ